MKTNSTLSITRLPYRAPGIEVIEVAYEGVIAGSGTTGSTLPDIPSGGSAYGSSMQSPYSSSAMSDIEDLIDDILTIEQ